MSWGTLVKDYYIYRVHHGDVESQLEDVEAMIKSLERDITILAVANFQYEADADGFCPNMEYVTGSISDAIQELGAQHYRLAQLHAVRQSEDYDED